MAYMHLLHGLRIRLLGIHWFGSLAELQKPGNDDIHVVSINLDILMIYIYTYICFIIYISYIIYHTWANSRNKFSVSLCWDLCSPSVKLDADPRNDVCRLSNWNSKRNGTVWSYKIQPSKSWVATFMTCDLWHFQSWKCYNCWLRSEKTLKIPFPLSVCSQTIQNMQFDICNNEIARAVALRNKTNAIVWWKNKDRQKKNQQTQPSWNKQPQAISCVDGAFWSRASGFLNACFPLPTENIANGFRARLLLFFVASSTKPTNQVVQT